MELGVLLRLAALINLILISSRLIIIQGDDPPLVILLKI